MMHLDEQESFFFDAFGPVDDGYGSNYGSEATYQVAAPPPPYIAPPSVQPISITSFDSPTFSPVVDDVMMPWDVPTFIPPVSPPKTWWLTPPVSPVINDIAPSSPPAPETYFRPEPSPFDMINIDTRAIDPVRVPIGDDFSLADLVGVVGSNEQSSSLVVAPLPQPASRPLATFKSLTDLDSSTAFSSSSTSSGRSMVLPVLAVAAALLLLD